MFFLSGNLRLKLLLHSLAKHEQKEVVWSEDVVVLIQLVSVLVAVDLFLVMPRVL